MKLTKALALPVEKGVTALVGGGGKTSLMYALGAEYARENRPVIITTTTRIGIPEPGDVRMADTESAEHIAVPGTVICVGENREEGKLSYPGDEVWERCLAEADRVFAEADGAKMMPVKAPAGHEPCLNHMGIDSVVAVAGLSALGKPMEDICFRLDIACSLLDVERKAILTPEMLAKLLTSPEGQLKNVASKDSFRVFLNQADNDILTERGRETAAWIKKFMPGCRVVIGALKPSVKIREIL